MDTTNDMPKFEKKSFTLQWEEIWTNSREYFQHLFKIEGQ